MKIENICLKNFRQYYGPVSVDLNTSANHNIVLIGGKNGYGKTNFLIALVWCLYGEKISQVDDNFKKEIQKENNYARFMKQSLNWESQKEGESKFSIEIKINNIELPDNIIELRNETNCIIRREFDTKNMVETLSICSGNLNKEIFNTDEDKINFINDYLIPVEAAKFVFFDAEKIASLAELSTKEEGSVLNDALGKLLGLDIYEGLVEDLKTYANNLRKDGANENIREQITNAENAIELNKNKIENIYQNVAQNESKIKEHKQKINDFQNYLNEYSKKDGISFNREEVINKKKKLEDQENEIALSFNELSEIIPLAMLSGKLEEVSEHIEIQEKNFLHKETNTNSKMKLDTFIENLFNKPPEPEDAAMSFKQKVFYSQKAQQLIENIFENKENPTLIEFEHDLSNADKELISSTVATLRQQSKENFEKTIDNYKIIQNEIIEIENLLKKIDANLQDEHILDYLIKKEDTEKKVEKLLSENGALANQKDDLTKQNTRLSQNYQLLLQKVTVTQQRKLKLEKANTYIETLQSFIVAQKREKKDNLSKNIYEEMQKLMHKLQNSDFESKFIAEVKVDILPDDTGMKVTLFDEDGKIRNKESLSQGEKQLYISSLIKAILLEAVQEFPIFIDTPLGRLDDEHIKNILLYYYPNLSSQVVILATNNEITPKRFNDIKNNVANSYLLENRSNKTTFTKGYYQNYEN